MPDNHNEDDDGAHPHVDDGPAGAAGGPREKNKRRRKRADGGAEFAKKGLHHEKYNLFDVLDFKYKKVSDTMVASILTPAMTLSAHAGLTLQAAVCKMASSYRVDAASDRQTAAAHAPQAAGAIETLPDLF